MCNSRVCLTLLALILPGCSQTNTPATTVASESSRPNRTTLVTYDLGVIRPRTVHEHRFHFVNSTASHWSVADVHTSCSCVATQVSHKIVPPAASAWIDVRYTAGDSIADVAKSITLRFSDAPPIAFRLEGAIRNPLTVSDRAVRLGSAPVGRKQDVTLVADNFSTTDWSSVKVVHSSAALTTNVRELSDQELREAIEGPYLPRQRFIIDARVDTTTLGMGSHCLRVELSADSNDNADTASTELLIDVVPAFSVIPKECFFGNIRSGHSAVKRQIVNVYADDLTAPNPPVLSVGTSSPRVRCRLRPLTPQRYELLVELTPDSSGYIEDTIELRWGASNTDETVIRIPVLGRAL
jgi:hypothetical protein